jgi:hypothetical protein
LCAGENHENISIDCSHGFSITAHQFGGSKGILLAHVSSCDNQEKPTATATATAT